MLKKIVFITITTLSVSLQYCSAAASVPAKRNWFDVQEITSDPHNSRAAFTLYQITGIKFIQALSTPRPAPLDFSLHTNPSIVLLDSTSSFLQYDAELAQLLDAWDKMDDLKDKNSAVKKRYNDLTQQISAQAAARLFDELTASIRTFFESRLSQEACQECLQTIHALLQQK